VTRFFEFEVGPPSSLDDPLHDDNSTTIDYQEDEDEDVGLRANPTWLKENFWYKVRAAHN